MSRIMTRICIVVCLFLLMNCSASNPTNPSLVVLEEIDNGKTMTIRTGGTLQIQLEGNPTTGYAWEVDSLDSAILQFKDRTFTPESEAVGAGGVVTLSFTAMAAGRTHLKLIYHRPWEEGIAPLKTFEAIVVVVVAE